MGARLGVRRDASQQRYQGSQGPRPCPKPSQPVLIRYNSEFMTQGVPAEGGRQVTSARLAAGSPLPLQCPHLCLSGLLTWSRTRPPTSTFKQHSSRLRMRCHGLPAGAAGRSAQSGELPPQHPGGDASVASPKHRATPRDGPRQSPLRPPQEQVRPPATPWETPGSTRATSRPRAPRSGSHRPACGLR